MNPGIDMIVLIVLIVTIGKVLQSRYRHRQDTLDVPDRRMMDVTPNETARLKDEVSQLKQRIQVLERIAVDKENSVAREIEQLRDR